jgi:hypothetical protein
VRSAPTAWSELKLGRDLVENGLQLVKVYWLDEMKIEPRFF